jgi:uridylate kinase
MLLHDVLAHLDAGPSDYSLIVGAGLGLHAEKLSEEYPVGIDPQECFAKMDEDRSVEDAVGVEIEVLNTIILQEPLEEVACWESQPALHESREHRDLIRILLHRVWISRGGAPHVDLLLPEKSVTPDFTRKIECISYVRQDQFTHT